MAFPHKPLIVEATCIALKQLNYSPGMTSMSVPVRRNLSLTLLVRRPLNDFRTSMFFSLRRAPGRKHQAKQPLNDHVISRVPFGVCTHHDLLQEVLIFLENVTSAKQASMTVKRSFSHPVGSTFTSRATL